MPPLCERWRARESEVGKSNISSSNTRRGPKTTSRARIENCRRRYERGACISLNMSLAVIACLSDFFFFFLPFFLFNATPPNHPPHNFSFCCFWCLKMCRQRKVNTDIVPPNKRASPYISNGCLCRGVFSSGGSPGISLTLCGTPRTRVCVKCASLRGGGPGGAAGAGLSCRCVDTSQQRDQCAGLTF